MAASLFNKTFFKSSLYAFRIKKEYLGNRFRQSGGPYTSGIFDRPPCSPKASSKVTVAAKEKAVLFSQLDGFVLICTCRDWKLFYCIGFSP